MQTLCTNEHNSKTYRICDLYCNIHYLSRLKHLWCPPAIDMLIIATKIECTCIIIMFGSCSSTIQLSCCTVCLQNFRISIELSENRFILLPTRSRILLNICKKVLPLMLWIIYKTEYYLFESRCRIYINLLAFCVGFLINFLIMYCLSITFSISARTITRMIIIIIMGALGCIQHIKLVSKLFL